MHIAGISYKLKVLLIISASFTLLFVMLLIGSKTILLDSFLEIENNSMTRNIDRTINALNDELAHLSTINGDYSGWDEAYRFMQDGNSKFIKANIPDTIFPQLHINVLMYVTNEGKIRYSRGFDLEKGIPVSLSDSFLKNISGNNPLIRHQTTESILSGILPLPEGLMMVTSRPVLTNEYKGPIHGALIIGRYLTQKEVDTLAHKISLQLSIHRYDDQQIPSDVKIVKNEFTDNKSVLIHLLNKEIISGYILMKDIFGRKALILKVELPRKIYKQGIKTVRYFVLWFLFGGLVFSLISYLFFTKLAMLRRKEQESEERYRSVVEQASEGIILVTLEGKRIVEGNATFKGLIGDPNMENGSLTLYDITEGERGKLDLDIELILRGKRELRFKRRDGYLIDVELSANIIHQNENNIMCIVVHDITDRKGFEEQLMHQANHDSLTGLANRNLLNDRIQQAIALQKRKSNVMSVMMLDLDNFKIINDTLGHTAGDLLLTLVAARLNEKTRKYDTVARIGGDEFVIVISEIVNVQDINKIAKNILSIFFSPFRLNDNEIFINGSVGVAIFPLDGDSCETLLMKADTAMYHCKANGKNNYQFFSEEMNKKVSDRLSLETKLRRAIELDEFTLNYQPRVDLNTGKICGMEALIRWHQPENGYISPEVFIPIAEETGLIIPIGEWVLRTACRHNKQWQENGFQLQVSVNLSPRQLPQHNLIEMIQNILIETGLSPNSLELELTEGLLMRHEDNNIQKLNALNGMGISLSIDDFGTGYSSLSYLKQFPIKTIKIDRSFVKDILINPDTAVIVKTILAMAKCMNLRVVAEGVEIKEQLAFLLEHQCDEIQGYYFSRPLSAESFTELITSGIRLVPDHENVSI